MDNEGSRPYWNCLTGYEAPQVTNQIEQLTQQIAIWKRERDEFEAIAKCLLKFRCGGRTIFSEDEICSANLNSLIVTERLEGGMTGLKFAQVSPATGMVNHIGKSEQKVYGQQRVIAILQGNGV